MLEVEFKFRLNDPEGLLAQLVARGVSAADEAVERDLYFAHPMRDFAATDEALRLRWDGRAARCTYKGPLLDRVSKSREEIEFQLAGESGFETARQVLLKLGFRELRPVVKRRRTYSVPFDGQAFLVVIDDVENLGLFVELEALCEPAEFEATRDAL